MGYSKTAEAIIKPIYFEFIRPIPPLACGFLCPSCGLV